MSRRNPTPLILAPELICGTSNGQNITILPSGSTLKVDFSHLSGLDQLGAKLFDVIDATPKRRSTLRNLKARSLKLVAALQSVCKKNGWQLPKSADELAPAMVEAAIAHLKSTLNGSERTRSDDINAIISLVRSVVRFPVTVPEIRSISTISSNWVAFSSDEAAKVISAARSDIQAIMSRHRYYQAFLDSEVLESAESRPGYDELVRDWLVELKGEVSRAAIRSSAVGRRWSADVKRQGIPKFEIFRSLVPAYEDLMPFMVMMSAISGLNLSSVLDLEMDAFGETSDGVVCQAIKHRIGGHFVTEPLSSDQSAEAVPLFADILELTARGRSMLSASEGQNLWIHIRNGTQHSNSPITYASFEKATPYWRALSKWKRRHGLEGIEFSHVSSRFRKYAGKQAYDGAIAAGDENQFAAIESAARRLGHLYGLLRREYAHACITDGDAVRAVRDFETSLQSRLDAHEVARK